MNHAEPMVDRVCPFCPLHCDDLTVSADGEIQSGGCDLAKGQLKSIPSLVPSIGGKPVSHQQAVAEAARLLGAAKAPLVSGLACDVDGLREAIAIADITSGYFDHGASDGFFNALSVLQRRGALMTTPAEVRNRADVLVVFGTEIFKRLPRFFERYVPDVARLFDAAPPRRKIFLLGGKQDPGEVPGADVTVIEADLDRAPELLLVLDALVEGRTPKVQSAAGVGLDRLAEVAQALKSSRYGVLAWEGPALGAQGDLAIEALYDLIINLHKVTRVAGLPLPPGGHLIGAHQVGLWQAGTALRTGFASGSPDYDPRVYSTRRLLAENRVDALLWITALPGPVPPKTDGVPTVVLSSQALPDGIVPDVFIPTAIPSLDHDSAFFRGEGVVSIHASAWRKQPAQPSVAQTLSEVIRLLPNREAASC